MTTPGMTAPDASTTVPPIVPVACCAVATSGYVMQRVKNKRPRRRVAAVIDNLLQTSHASGGEAVDGSRRRTCRLGPRPPHRRGAELRDDDGEATRKVLRSQQPI